MRTQSRARLGRVERSDPEALRPGRRDEAMRAEADLLRRDIDTSAKLRRFAEEYTRDQIETLCALIVKHCSSIKPTVLLALLRIHDRSRRDAMMRQAIHEGWSTGHLRRAIQATRGGRRQHVGRRPLVPADSVELLIGLEAAAEKWCRNVAAATPGLPTEMLVLIEKATKAARRVQEANERMQPMDVAGSARRQR